MRVSGKPTRTIWSDEGLGCVLILDQTQLPSEVRTVALTTLDQSVHAIASMQVRGAPLIGVAAAFGVWLAMRADSSDESLHTAKEKLLASRPTAVNLSWAVHRVCQQISAQPNEQRARFAHRIACELAEEDVRTNEAIGRVGAEVLKDLWRSLGCPQPFVTMTHCNAGWLATVDRGTALSPIYHLAAEGFRVHVLVSETRPRNQGLLTAWELAQEQVPYTLVVDNACGHLLRRKRVHAVIVGCDRLAANGDVCNKIGTYLKALAAFANDVPLFAAVPTATIDPTVATGELIPIEERAANEVHPTFAAENPAFDVTPARYVRAIFSERGVVEPNPQSIAQILSQT